MLSSAAIYLVWTAGTGKRKCDGKFIVWLRFALAHDACKPLGIGVHNEE